MTSPHSLPTGTVTFLFTDVEGSTRKWEAHGEDMREALTTHDRIVRSAIEVNGGSVFTTAGDAFCSAFSLPVSALAASIAIQRDLSSEPWGSVGSLRVRAAIHAGVADERDGDYFGPSLNRCARLLSLGHGGQILVSSAAAHLLMGGLPQAATLRDLGEHELKDLDRPERVYQVAHPDLEAEFPPLASLDRSGSALLAMGRAAHSARSWAECFQAFRSASEEVELDSHDLKLAGEAAYWSGHIDDAITFKERAFGKLVSEDHTDTAAIIALDLAFLYKYRLAGAVSKAWASRAQRLLTGPEVTEAKGYLLRWQTVIAFESEGDPEKALALADETIAAGIELGDRSIEALGLMDKGRILVSMGRVEEGMELVDESMIAVVAGEVDPDTTGRNYCNMLAVCDLTADYGRAREWSEAAESWCKQHSDSAYPGICRIFKAELRWLKGEWHAATGDLKRAIDELHGFTPIIGAALYQIGEVELRAGNLDDAEEHFNQAHEHGYPPMPGIARLRRLQGDPHAAQQLLLDALAGNVPRLQRTKLLPELIDTALELGLTEDAKGHLAELEEVAELCRSTALRAQAADRQAALRMSEGETADAIADLRKAIDYWTQLQMPYEAAESRRRLGAAHRISGNEAAAVMEIEAANKTLSRLSTPQS